MTLFPYEQSELGEYYRGYERLMKHWHKVMPGWIYDISYEALVADLETGTRGLLDFCQLEFQPTCLEFHKTSRTVRTASAIQVRKPVYSSSVDSWRHYEKHIGPLINALEGI